MRTVLQSAAVAMISMTALFLGVGKVLGVGKAHAGLDNEKGGVDGDGRTLTVQQWGTFLNGVTPMDRNRLTREWFPSGKAVYTVTGPGSENFSGTLELGYRVGFPWTVGLGLGFDYVTPNVLLSDADISGASGPGGC